MSEQPTLALLAEKLGAEVRLAVGASDRLVPTGLNTLQDANKNEVSFLASAAYKRFLPSTRACAVLVTEEQADMCPVTALVVPNPYQAFALATSIYDRTPQYASGVDSSAVVAPTAQVHESAYVGPGAVIEAHARVAENAVIGAGSFVGVGTTIGARTRLFPGVVLYHGCMVGADCTIHSNTVVGADGFGFAPSDGKWIKIHQLGGVEIADEVEVGANTCIDRGALGNTVIGRGVKIDNMVQIAHNVQIGDYSAMAACSAVAGSAIIGKHCTIAGGVGIVGHVTIADRSHVTARTLVTKSIEEAGSYSSGTPFSDSRSWRRNAVRFGQLDQMARRVSSVEKALEKAGQGGASQEQVSGKSPDGGTS
ncbi:UDP-3-O-(3-hydroxymyristoyl)glucosamine N-acyltransferase [Microbulbifer hydrolyticus]|uniref:UDP-3-O-acylglucosamine N-acyltransferase n=1 Tax=Microbulbifer hydrolyticus TaxID=48074 RepID=A0A6P1T9R3_9GAMM|nr:UDP-3-O-(3-hydroxymyristoyl)glucosamine N-acyltransferase [Microbulbifer hydrolyticus]MBB5209947.1 UDP-3-O-[3-hydroxymyristoyl] glucosamine N-acyltransferase [Microbulbifer hydrolyticus]QHQ39518.1 UDP-3-O-(3-hydroxymyristoyl)glucosamine N-acyltransferase [Microbulbifer hydrolyticus]